ncbi:molybdate transport system substrate-binding protein [Saccharopolyspora lacisalsi]|uniref:Molybdate transport system substrate-binding protein n=1 Tax=Halosaccharopolyspora lacisalsi TaxID=1000566 RepID=A0A839E0U8_9PSEU|nr:molybdate ABC transporter substrate-binding protein [Halosaccharopolyspora lacisalsi]MBA8826720.1 molybdate transport system substrate-binding protein [Halosaccharopolyspora lacisalsi]
MRNRFLVGGLVLLLAVLTGCGQAGNQGRKELTVLAAASLMESFREIRDAFVAEHPDVGIDFDFQGSSLLAEQIRQGRPADVYASADARTMRKVVRSGRAAGDSKTFATNRLTIVVPPDNPAGVTSFADLAGPGEKVVTCAPQVPCGAATERVERVAGVRLSPVSEETDVKDVLNKVVAGEADAGLVYVTDAHAAGEQVRSIDFPASHEVLNTYPVVSLEDAADPELATEFMAFVRGPKGREILAEYGFGAP